MTAQSAAPGLPPAGLGRRWVASLIDSLVGATAWGVGAMWLVLGVWWLRGLPRNGRQLLVILIALAALGVVLRLVLQVTFVGGCGQTLGQMALGIGVVNAAGEVPGYGRALLRWLGGLLTALTLGLLSLPFIFARDRRGIADRLGGTRVVLLSPRATSGPRVG